MAAVNEITFLQHVCDILKGNGFDGISRCVEILVNEAMRIERCQALAAQPYQRTDERKGLTLTGDNETYHSHVYNA